MLIFGAIAAFGFLFLVVMLFVGDLFGADHDIGGHDVGADHDLGGGPSIFSARIMASFLAAFGVGGIVGRYYALSYPAASGVGVVTGVVLSAAVYEFARILYSQQASSAVRMSQLMGQSAEVSIAIPKGGLGQVALAFGGERTEHIARTLDGRAIERGTAVVITDVRGDSVVVAPAESQVAGGRHD